MGMQIIQSSTVTSSHPTFS
uniref:Uncharacterized protein n=1 Tax=Arundo donax TaxID=35708 RepID=A0A0A9AK82_ARUDO